MVETGAGERTSHTHKNQRAAEQRETEEPRDVGDELKMAACLLLLLFSSLNTTVSVSGTETRIRRQQKASLSVRLVSLNVLKMPSQTKVTWKIRNLN